MPQLTAEANLAYKPIEFQTVFSLDYLFDFWTEEGRTNAHGLGSVAVQLMKEVDAVPELRGDLVNRALLEEHEHLLAPLFSAVLPTGLTNLAFAALAMPTSWDFFRATPRFRKELMSDRGQIRGELLIDGLDWEYLRSLFSYMLVVRHCYGVNLPFSKSILVRNQDRETGLFKVYQMRAQFDMLRVEPKGELPPIDLEAIRSLGQEMTSLEAWRKLVPADQFLFRGFVVYEATDVSEEANRSHLKEILVKPEPLIETESFHEVEKNLQALLGLPNLNILVVGIEGESAFCMDGSNGFRHNAEEAALGHYICESCRSELFQGEEVLHSDLREAHLCSEMLVELKDNGWRSFMMLPLRERGELLGSLCLVTDRVGELNSLTKLKLEGVKDLFTLALSRTLAAVQNKVQSVMKEKFTAIHPCVEWKFRAAALNYVRTKEIGDVVFPEAYSLFSSSDIRSSSELRNRAIRLDLIEQLRSAKQVLALAVNQSQIDYLSSLIYRLDRMIGDLEVGVRSGDETRIARLLSAEIEPVFESLDGLSDQVHDSVEGYRKAVCCQSGKLFGERRAYDESVDQLTRRLTEILNERQQHAQETFPHLFEMYRTDGVEHSIYIGNSLTERDDFSKLYLNEMKLWQLRTVCLMAQECFRLEQSLPQPLEVAHLILAQSDPIALRYSQEEKKFNVDGAYNSSYEIIKKRIDKAHIKGTDERLTQPGKIALVYTRQSDAHEYRLLLDYLQQQNLVQSGIEDLELEDLQGVYGLKALRVAVSEV